MDAYVDLGSAPHEEPRAQVGEPDYHGQVARECRRFIQLLRTLCGSEPEGARLLPKWFSHPRGESCKVVCYYSLEKPEAVRYAARCQAAVPTRWG